MAKLYDIRTGKEQSLPVQESYIQRKRACLVRAEELQGRCDCKICKEKDLIARKLLTVSKWLCTDYMDRTGNTLYPGDWFEVVVRSANLLKDIVYPKI